MTMGDRITATRQPSNNHTDPTTAATEHSQPRLGDPESGHGRTKLPPTGPNTAVNPTRQPQVTARAEAVATKALQR